MSQNHYDVIIIGGRCAGSSLALRLAGNDLKILLVDRATFPSLPNVPSAPFIHDGTMRLMDELGIPESEYTHDGSKIEHFMIDMAGYFQVDMPLSQIGLKRNYFCGIDRNLFDATLWKYASRADGVTARDGFSVTEILKDETGKVRGIVGKSTDGESESITADLVVGADGRFSFSARQFGAEVVETRNDHTSAVYFAEWKGVGEYSLDCPNAVTSYNTGRGFMVLVIPLGERIHHVATYMRSDEARFGGQGVEQAYHESLERIPHLKDRLKDARRITDIVGMRPIENAYRAAYGENWALVGDAVHYKDPADGQGIYDALLESKLLAETIIDWKQNETRWTKAGADYQQKMLAATHSTFLHTVANVKQTLYTNAPAFLAKTLIRWMMSVPDFQRNFLRYLSRAIPAEDFKQRPTLTMLINGIRGKYL